MADRDVDYRVVRKESEDGSDEQYSVQEVYYDGEKPIAYTLDLQVEGDTIPEMRKQLEKMLMALEEPVLDEQDIVSKEKIGKDGRGNDIYEFDGSIVREKNG